MPSHAKRIHDRFAKHTTSIEHTRSKMEALLSSAQVDLQDIEHTYAGLYLELFTNFEALIEELFLGLYSGVYISTSYTVIRTSRITPRNQIQPIIYAGKNYIDWLPYDKTEDRAKKYFKSGVPFNALSASEKKTLENYHVIRNAIAHKSSHSLKKFMELISPLTLLPTEKTPTGYLRSKPSGTLGQTQFEIAVIELKLLSAKLCS